MPIKLNSFEVTVEKGTNEYCFSVQYIWYIFISVGIKNILSRLTSIMLLVDFDINPVPLTARCKARSTATRMLRLWVRIPPVV